MGRWETGPICRIDLIWTGTFLILLTSMNIPALDGRPMTSPSARSLSLSSSPSSLESSPQPPDLRQSNLKPNFRTEDSFTTSSEDENSDFDSQRNPSPEEDDESDEATNSSMIVRVIVTSSSSSSSSSDPDDSSEISTFHDFHFPPSESLAPSSTLVSEEYSDSHTPTLDQKQSQNETISPNREKNPEKTRSEFLDQGLPQEINSSSQSGNNPPHILSISSNPDNDENDPPLLHNNGDSSTDSRKQVEDIFSAFYHAFSQTSSESLTPFTSISNDNGRSVVGSRKLVPNPKERLAMGPFQPLYGSLSNINLKPRQKTLAFSEDKNDETTDRTKATRDKSRDETIIPHSLANIKDKEGDPLADASSIIASSSVAVSSSREFGGAGSAQQKTTGGSQITSSSSSSSSRSTRRNKNTAYTSRKATNGFPDRTSFPDPALFPDEINLAKREDGSTEEIIIGKEMNNEERGAGTVVPIVMIMTEGASESRPVSRRPGRPSRRILSSTRGEHLGPSSNAFTSSTNRSSKNPADDLGFSANNRNDRRNNQDRSSTRGTSRSSSNSSKLMRDNNKKRVSNGSIIEKGIDDNGNLSSDSAYNVDKSRSNSNNSKSRESNSRRVDSGDGNKIGTVIISSEEPKAQPLVQELSPVSTTTQNYSKGTMTRTTEKKLQASKSLATSWQQPEKVWSEPAKVWSEPAKVWSEPAKVWSLPAQVWGNPEQVWGQQEKTWGQGELVWGGLKDTPWEGQEQHQGQQTLSHQPAKKIWDQVELNFPKNTPQQSPDSDLRPTFPHRKVKTTKSETITVDQDGHVTRKEYDFIRHQEKDVKNPNLHMKFNSDEDYQSDAPLTDEYSDSPDTRDEDYEDQSTQGTFVILGDDEDEQDSIDGELLIIPPVPVPIRTRTPPSPDASQSSSSTISTSSSSSSSIYPTDSVNSNPGTNHKNNQENNSSNNSNKNNSNNSNNSGNNKKGKKFGYVLEGSNLRRYRVEERTPDGFIVGEYGVLNNQNAFLRGVRYTADGTINPRLIHEALMKFLSLRRR